MRKLLFSKDIPIVSVTDVMKEVVTVSQDKEEENAHYFKVELIGVSSKETLLNEDVVEAYLIQHAPLPFKKEFSWASIIKEKCRIWGFKIPEYYIELNGHQLYKPYENTFVCDRVKKREDAISDIVVKPFYREDKLSAVFWYGETRFWGTVLNNEIKGIRIRQGNILIGNKSTCNILFKEGRFNGWMIGELHVIDSDLIVNARRDNFEQNEAHYDLTESFREWSDVKIREIRKISYQRSLSEKKRSVIENKRLDDVNNLLTEELDCVGESEYLDREESEEISEIDYMDKLSQLLNQKKVKQSIWH